MGAHQLGPSTSITDETTINDIIKTIERSVQRSEAESFYSGDLDFVSCPLVGSVASFLLVPPTLIYV